MSKPSRGSLASLSSRLVQKDAPASASAETQPALLPEALPPAAPVPDVRDLKTMMCRVNRAGWSEMSKLAIDRDVNLEDMLIEACNDLLRQHGRPPVIEKRSPLPRKPPT